MAQVHNELRKGVVSEAANRALGRTREGGIERLGETLDPVFNLWGMPEWAYLRQESLCAFQPSNVGAVAAEFGAVALVNETPNLLVVVEEVSAASTSAASAITLEIVTAAAARATLATSDQAGSFRDRRIRFGVTRARLIGGTDPSFVGLIIEQQWSPGGVQPTSFKSLPVILPPGQALVARVATVNVVMMSNWVWRERSAYPGELV